MTSPQPAQIKSIEVNAMHIEVIRDLAGWETLAEEWSALLQRSHVRTPFLTYEFQRAWWDHLGGGEWNDVDLNILVERAADNSALGIAPLFRTREGDLHLIGTHEIADFLDFIVSPENHGLFLQNVLDFLSANKDWRRLDLYNLLDTSRTTEVLSSLTVEKPWDFAVETLQPSPYIPVPSTFDNYVATLDSKQAHELRRKLRRAAKYPAAVSIEIIKDRDRLPSAMEEFFDLMCQEVDKRRFLTPDMRAQLNAIAAVAFDGGWLQLFFLRAGNKRIAGYMNFDYDNCIWAYNAGFMNNQADLSPGWLVMAEMMQWGIDHGRRIFDFMRGGEEYKYRFGAIDRFVQRVTISR